MSSLKIAEKLDCSVGVIIRTLRFHNIEIRIIKGENHPKWLGGVSFEPYCPKFNNEFKERVRAFWNRECGLCGLSEQDNGRKLSVHHVNYEKMVCCDDTPPLFIPLCSSCHAITNHNRRGWEHVLTEYIMIYFNGDSYSKP